MMDYRVAAIVGWALLGIAVVLLIAIYTSWNKITKYEPKKEATKTINLHSNAIVLSTEIFEYEKREGMRKVRVRLTVEHKNEKAEEIVITEWVPVVLLGHLVVGSSVQLIKDPLQGGRLTFGL